MSRLTVLPQEEQAVEFHFVNKDELGNVHLYWTLMSIRRQ